MDELNEKLRAYGEAYHDWRMAGAQPPEDWPAIDRELTETYQAVVALYRRVTNDHS
jgi:hypothetical protein